MSVQSSVSDRPIAPPPRGAVAVDEDRVLARARGLRAGDGERPLRHRNVALLCDDPDAPDARLFADAATRLGAHVAHVRPALDEFSSADDIRRLATMLGRLYDLVECQQIAPSLVGRLADAAAVPVFDGLSLGGRPLAELAPRVDAEPGRDTLLALVQAMLIGALR